MDNTLNKVRQISCIISTGAINFDDDTLSFNCGDKNTAFIHLRGNLDPYIKAQLKIKTPDGEIVLVEGKVITNNRNVSREFPLVIDKAGNYNCQLILSFKDKTNVSNIFSYTVNKSIGGDK